MSRTLVRHKPAPLCDRCIAYVIDGFLSGCGLACILYPCWKDGIRDGRSFGKGIMGLRVVKYGTRQSATVTDSCVRFCCDWCPCLLCVTGDRRHLGDYVAGTMVIKDR